MPRSVSALVLATALAVMLAPAGTAEAGRRHHHHDRHGDGDLAAWFALGSLVTFLAVANAHHHAHPPPPRRRHVHHGRYRHAHAVHPHVHRTPRHRRPPASGPRVLSHRHRHGADAWHVHALGHPRAWHRH